MKNICRPKHHSTEPSLLEITANMVFPLDHIEMGEL